VIEPVGKSGIVELNEIGTRRQFKHLQSLLCFLSA